MEASPTSFALRLSALPPDDLVTLLTHRPEAAELAARGTVTWGALASTLAAPRAVHDTLISLDRFLDQVLQLACVYGGRLDQRAAAAEGLDAAALATGAAELRCRGLAFSEADGTVVVPRNVLAQVWNPAGLGPRAETLLEHLTIQDLRPLATALDVPQPRMALRKRDLVNGIALRLADPDTVRALVAGAPENARAALAELRAAGGSSGAAAASSAWQRSYEWRPRWGHAGGPANGPAWLLAHGLVLPHDEWSSLMSVPLKVEHALRGRVFAAWQPDPPPLPLTPLRQERHPAELVAEMSALLDLWRHEPPPALQNGGVPKRELKRAGRTLRLAEEWVGDLAGLALAAGLLSEREVTPEKRSRSYRNPHVLQSRQAVIEVAAGSWDDLSAAERWLAVMRAWSKAATADPYVGRAWRLVLALLAELPEDYGVDAVHLGARLAWRHPASFPDAAAASRHTALAGSTLHALGVGGAEPAIGLGAIGRAVLLADGAVDPAVLDDAFPAPVETCAVTADHRVVVAGAPAQALAAFLALVADIVSVHPAHVYRLSDASLRRALDTGWIAERILAVLRERAPEGVPQNVAALVDDVARRHGRLRVGAAAQYVVADDPARIEQLLGSRAARALGLRRVAPTVAVAEAQNVKQVLGVLRAAGLMPVTDTPAEAETPPIPAVASARRRTAAEAPRALGLLSGGPTLGRREAEALAARLRAAPKAITDEIDAPLEPVRQVLTTAASQHRTVEIEYHASSAATPLRVVVQPYYVSGNVMEAYDRGRMRRFDVRSVVWAQPVTAEEAAAQLWP